MVDPLYRALVLAALGLAGCEDSHSPDAGPAETDVAESTDIQQDDTSGEEDAPCPADAELATPPCYLIL